MRKQPKMSLSAAKLVITRTVTDQLQEHDNPIDWVKLEKAMHAIMHELDREIGKWYPHDQAMNLVLTAITSQITTDYKQGVSRLAERYGWLRRKFKNVV